MSTKKASRSKEPVASSRGFDRELAELESLAEAVRAAPAPAAEQIEALRKALGHRNNFLVAKAAKLATDLEIAALLPDVLAAYERFFVDAVKTDPQCWAKNALSKALVKLGHRGKDAYLRGLGHIQLEPVWGGSSDTAGALRGTCTHALVDCPGLSDAEILTALLDPMTDTDKTVREEAARAIGQVGGIAGSLLLRLRAKLAKDEPEVEVMGAVYSSLLGVEGAAAIPLVAAAMKDGEDLGAEAAYALAEMRTPAALAALRARLAEGADSWFGGVLLSAIALTRLGEGLDFLIALIARDGRQAAEAIEALGRLAPNAELRARMEQAVEQAGSPRLRQAMGQHLGNS